MHGASSYLSIRLIFAILLLVGGMVVTGLLWLMKQVRRHEASKLGFVVARRLTHCTGLTALHLRSKHIRTYGFHQTSLRRFAPISRCVAPVLRGEALASSVSSSPCRGLGIGLVMLRPCHDLPPIQAPCLAHGTPALLALIPQAGVGKPCTSNWNRR